MRIELDGRIIEGESGECIQAAVRLFRGTTAKTLEVIRAWAIDEINRQVNDEVIRRGVLTGQLFFIANVSDIGFLVTEWRGEGRPEKPDPEKYYRAYTEAKAYAETSDPEMTAFKMLVVWETQWNWMRKTFADLNEIRRRALEQLKVAESEDVVAEILTKCLDQWGN